MGVRIGLVAALVLVGTVVLEATPAQAAVDLSLSRSHVTVGSSVTVSGVVGTRFKRPVLVQATRAGGRWMTVGRTRTRGKRFTATTVPFRTSGSWKVRVRVPAARGRRGLTSPSRALTVRAVPPSSVLRPGGTLKPGGYLQSPNGTWRLTLRQDGNLALTAGATGAPVWQIGPAAGVSAVRMGSDGNFGRFAGTVLGWHTNTHGFDGAALELRDDASLVVTRRSRVLWSRSSGYLGHRLGPAETLWAGDQLISMDHRFSLSMQNDGNLVQRDRATGVSSWSTGTGGGSGHLAVQSDGNLVVHAGGRAAWAANSAGFPSTWLVLDDTGNAVLRSRDLPVWASRDGYLGGRLTQNQVMQTNDVRISPNGQYLLIMQSDGNLVLYRRNGPALWATATSGDNYAIMQGDGNLVVYRRSGGAAWASRTDGRPGASLEVQNDDNLVLYRSGTAVWSRKSGVIGGGGGGGGGDGALQSPFAPGVSGYVCQGYNGAASHSGEPSLDLTLQNNSWGSTGCWGDPHYSTGQPVYAPVGGSLAQVSANWGGVCISYGNRSVYLGHLNNRRGNGAVSAGDLIGHIAAPGQVNNGGFAHVHFQAHGQAGCGANKIPFTAANNTKIKNTPDLPNNGSVSQWRGTRLIR